MPDGKALTVAETHLKGDTERHSSKHGRDSPDPLTEQELAEFEARMEEQAETLREALAEDLGGDPEDYRPERVADG